MNKDIKKKTYKILDLETKQGSALKTVSNQLGRQRKRKTENKIKRLNK